MHHKMRTVRARANRNLVLSFKNAFSGFYYLLRSQRNTRYHSAATIFSLYMVFWLKVPLEQFLAILIVICLVWATEALNSASEKMLDLVRPKYSRRAKKVKDMAAAGVLISSITALIVGLMVLGPPLYQKVLSF
ncbi:diacylglycerol kinase family protein [Omnitrophica bacterium]|nr:diacylglycerol kinase family protein [Candidatus Omnitrophota bacterium]